MLFSGFRHGCCVVVIVLGMACAKDQTEGLKKFGCYQDICNAGGQPQFCDKHHKRCTNCNLLTAGCMTSPPPECYSYCRSVIQAQEKNILKSQQCSALPSIHRGRYNGTADRMSPLGTIITSICDQGYQVHGSPVTVCTEYGRWSNELPTCKDPLDFDVYRYLFLLVSVLLSASILGNGLWFKKMNCYKRLKPASQEYQETTQKSAIDMTNSEPKPSANSPLLHESVDSTLQDSAIDMTIDDDIPVTRSSASGGEDNISNAETGHNTIPKEPYNGGQDGQGDGNNKVEVHTTIINIVDVNGPHKTLTEEKKPTKSTYPQYDKYPTPATSDT